MEITYREPQTPLFPPPYVNLVREKEANPNITPTVTLQSQPKLPAHVLDQPDLHSRIIDTVLPDIAIKTNKNW